MTVPVTLTTLIKQSINSHISGIRVNQDLPVTDLAPIFHAMQSRDQTLVVGKDGDGMGLTECILSKDVRHLACSGRS